MSGISAILLAAGESRRMGEPNKLELKINNIPMLLHTTIRLLASPVNEVIVVVGHEEEKARRILAGLPISIVTNEHYRDGQMTSVQKGLSSLKHLDFGVMVCLCDQPLMTVNDYSFLINTFQHTTSPVLIPTWMGERGNPVMISADYVHEIRENAANPGCRQFIENNPELVSMVEMPNNHVIYDLDTPEDYDDYQSLTTALPVG